VIRNYLQSEVSLALPLLSLATIDHPLAKTVALLGLVIIAGIWLFDTPATLRACFDRCFCRRFPR